MYKWTSDLSVGNHLIDSEHQHLFELLEQFYAGMKGQVAPIDLLSLTKGLIEYAEKHFADEEAYMKKINYPDMERHVALHRAFIGQVNEFYGKMQSKKLVLTLEVTNFVKEWLVAHIKGEDTKIIKHSRSISSM
ncbi:MAG: bacteriohemerythrin [Breznakibacter sp.]